MVDNNTYFIVTILCLQTIYNCILSIVGQYIYGFFLQTYPNIPHNGTNVSFFVNDHFDFIQEQCTENPTTDANSSAQAWAQQRSANLIFRATLWRAFPVIVVTYLFGLYASHLNRRLVLLVSIFGNAMHVVIYQAIIYKNLAEYWWYVSAFIAGCSGGTNVLGIVINLVITESTDEAERSSRFVRLGALTTALSAAVTFGIGYYIQWRGFTDLFWMAIALEVVSILVVIFLLEFPHVSRTNVDETTSLLSSSTSNNEHVEIKNSTVSNRYRCFDMCAIFSFNHRSRMKSFRLMLVIVSYVFHLLALAAMSPLLWYLLGAPFCWSSKDLGNFSAISLISTAIFSVLGMKLLNYYGANDALICALGHICLIGYTLWIALAKHSWQLFLALLINPFSGYQSALTLPMISKWLEVHERSNIFTLITEINTIILAFGSSFFNWVYARTVMHQKNFTLLFAGGISIVPLLLNLCLFMITRRASDEQETTTIVPEVDVEPATLSLPNSILPQAADVACLVLPSRSRSNSFSVSHNDRSRANSHSSYDDSTERNHITI